MFLPERLRLLHDDFMVFDDPHERLNAVLDRSRPTPALPASQRIDANRVPGCVSVVWLVGERHGAVCRFRSDAESALVRGLVAFVCEFFTDAPAAEIANYLLDPLAELGLTKHLSPTRKNGLAAVQTAIRAYAQAQTA
ncbi:MAG: SufE family protein [Opitutaceae bacterium]